MSCPVCGRILCDHSPDERGQSSQEMMTSYYDDEDSVRKISQLKYPHGIGPATPFHPNSYNPRRYLPEHLRPSDWGLGD
jgi:hypothetical protein